MMLRATRPSLSLSLSLLPRTPIPTSTSIPISPYRSFTTTNIKDDFERKAKIPNMSVKQVLAGRTSSTFTVDQRASIREAISHLVGKKISSSLILDNEKEIVGIVTARDLLKFVNDISSSSHHMSGRAIRGAAGIDAFLTHKVTEVMTPVDRMIYCSPKDTVKHCREIM
jgi:CBS-domain-containing membrane protein